MKKIYFLVLALFSVVIVKAQTVTHLHDPSSVCIDGSTQNLGAVTFTTSNFPNGCEITDVDVTIWWAKTDGTCAAPTGTGCSFHNETSFALNGPSSNEVLAIAGSWSGCASSASSVTTTFNTGSPAIPAPTTPVSGTYSPNGGSLANYNGQSALGTWSLAAGDNAGLDPLLVGAYRLVVTTTPDLTNPVMTVPSTITVSNDAGQCGATVNYSVSSTDVCGSTHALASSAGTASGQFFPVGTTVATWVATDGYGNQHTNSFNIVVNDTEAPSITCPANITTTVAAGTCAQNVTYASPTHSDNCGTSILSLTSGPASGGSFPAGPTTVTYTAIDPSSNTASCSFTVTVNDNIPPTISCPADFSVNVSAGQCSATVNYATVTANDNCPGVTVARTAGPASGSTVGVGTTTITHVATDAASNTASCSFVVTVVDNQAPAITCPANITVGNIVGNCGALVSWTDPVGTDNCPGSVTVQSAGPASGSPFTAETTTTISFEVTDGAGATASCSFTVTVDDTELPVLTCPANINTTVDAGQCSAVVSFADATFSDNCPGGSISQTGGLPSNSQFGVNSSPNTVTYTATDAAGNTGTCSFTISVSDDENPTIACPTDIVVDNDPGQCDAVVNWTEPVGSDNCPGQSTVRTGPAPGSTFNVLTTTTISYQVTDASSNTADCSFTITVEDNDFPIVSCPADQNITFPGCQYTLPDYLGLGLVTRTDNCTPLVELQTPVAGTVVTEETTVQISITDPSLNETICAFTITPLDNTPPTFDNCPTTVDSVSVNNSCQFFMPDYSTLGVSDVCNPTLTFSQVPPAGIPLTVTTSVTVTVTDGTNETDCTFDVAPRDDTAPTIVCPADDLVSANVDCETTLADYTGDATVADNCDTSVDVSQSPTGTVAGNTTVTLTATDDAGNTASCTFEVEVEDTTPPSISCPTSETVYYNASCLYSMEDHTGLATGVSDNCAQTVIVTQVPVFGTSIGSDAVVELIATDDAGNTNSCTFNLLISDTVSPTLVCPLDQTIAVDTDCEATLTDYTGLASASDNCPALNTVTVSQSPTAGNTFDLTTDPTVVVTISATDGANTSSCTFNVILQDNIDPVLVCPNPAPVTANANCEFVLTNFVNGDPVGTDNCDVALSFSQVPAPSTVIQGNTLVTLYGEDDAGNVGSCSFTLVVDDNTDPSIICPPNQTVEASAICDFELNTYAFMATTDDNCDGNVTVSQSPAAGTTQTTDVLVTLTGTDDAGNTSNCNFSVLISDVTPPSITCPSDTIVDFGISCTFVLDDYVGDETTADNCDVSIGVTQSPASGTSHSGTTTVTLTALDDGGNQSTCTFNVIPEDNTDPTIGCPDDQIVSSSISGGNCVFFIPDLTGSATVSDNCDTSPSVTQSPGVGNIISANTTITLTAEDADGNTDDCTFDLILNDDADPSITCPGDLSVEVDSDCLYEILNYTSLAVASDNCSSDPTVTQGTTPAIGSTIGPGVPTTITLTAEDDSSNTDVCTFIITAFDVTGPTVTCPATTVVPSNTNCLVFLADYTGNGTVLDNCDGTSPTILQSPVAGTAIGGTTEVTLYAVDNSGNLGECVFDVELNDQTPPSIVCPADQVVPSDASCGYVLADYSGFGTTEDNCDLNPVVTQSPASPANVSGVTSVTLTSSDASGNSSNCTFSVSAEDVIVPTITNCPENDTVTVAANCTHIMGDYSGLPTYSDNCDPASNIVVAQTPLSGSLIGGNTTVTITATDVAGNSGTCTFLVVPEDNDPPTIFDCPSDITQDNDPSLCGAVVTYGPITAIDNCAGVIVPQLDHGLASGSIFDVATTEVEYIADDGNGNTTSCVFNVTIIDAEDPVVLCPTDITVDVDPGVCGADVTYALPTVTDNCPAPSAPALDSGLASGSTFPVGTTTNTYSSTDGAGNTSSCSFNVTVNDNEAPTITCPPDQTVDNDPGSCDAVATYPPPTIGDNCPAPIGPTLVSGGASGDAFPVGTSTITYSVEDASGNTNNCTFSITVEDNEAPLLSCPADTLINCDAIIVYNDPTVTDNCVTGIVPIQTAPPIGDPLAFGPNLITFSADDGNGNTGTCSFTITVIDTIVPVITCPADLTESFDANCELSAPDYTGLAVATDNCDAAPAITQSPTPGSTIIGTATITLIATDFAGNSSDCSFNVIDDTPPAVDCPADIVVGSDNNCEFTLVDYTLASTSLDNCGDISLSQDPAVGTVIGTLTTVTITSTDDFGNTADCQFTVDLIDNIDPSITCVGNQTVLFDTDCSYELADYTANIGTTDNCDPNVVVTQDPVATTLVFGATTVTMTATDASGNAVSCSFDISPIDVLPPTISCPATQTADFDANCEFALADYTGMGITDDNCSAVDVTQSPAAGAILSSNTVITLTATDADLNATSCTFVVIPEDNVDPTIACPADFEVDFDVNCNYTLVDYTSMGTPDDNCSTQFTITQSPSLGTIVSGSTSITLTADDGNGNSEDCSFSITPVDNTPPTIACIDDQTVSFDENCEYQLSDYNGSATTSDNCSSIITVSQSPAAGTLILGATEIILTGDDGNGNTANCTFMVLPEDDTDPTIACPNSLNVQFGGQGCAYLMADLTSLATADDNCATVVSVTQDPVIGTLITDTISVTFTAYDDNGNSASCSFEVNPSDETDPTAACPPDIVVDFNEDCEFELLDYKPDVVTSDNCGLTILTQDPLEGTLITAETEIIITVDDGNGNSTTCSFTVTPNDNTAPTIVCPNNLIEDLDENCQFEMPDYTTLATAEDNCSNALIIDQFPPTGTVILTSTVVTLSVEDDNGNENECSFVVLPEDNTTPEIADCPENQFASLDENCELAMPDFTGMIQATDNCDIDISYQQLPLAGSAVAGVGIYAITLGAGDDNNNFDICEFDLIVTDDSDPTVDCPADQTIELNANCQFEVPDFTGMATAADACGAVTLTQSPVEGSIITGQLNATIIAEDENGNTSTCTFFVDVVEMAATVSGTDATCQGGSDGTATVTVIGGTAPYTEDWGGFDPGALAQGVYAVTVTDVNGCSTTASVSIGDGPLFEIEIDPTGTVEICEGDLITLDAGSGYAAYNWSTGASVQTITVSNEASYWVTVTNANGCVSNTDTVQLSFYNDPLPTVISTADGIISCSNDTASSYQWYLNGAPITGATNSYYCPLESGNYYVVITDANGCEVTSNVEEYTYDDNSPCATGIAEHGLTLDVYPNPSDGLFTVSYALDHQTDMRLAVYDLLGQRVTEDELISAQNGTIVIDLSGIADGIYTLRIALGTEKVLQQRLVLVK